METLLVPIALAILAIVVLVADIAPAEGESRGIGALAAAGFVAIFGLTFVAPTGTAFDGAWSNDLFTLYAQRLLLVAGALACIGAIDHADRGFPRRQGEYYLLLVSSVLGMEIGRAHV